MFWLAFHMCSSTSSIKIWLLFRATLEADDRQVARALIEEADAAVSAGRPLHRVTQYLVGHGLGTMRPLMQRFVDEGFMDPRLRTEITAYQLCMLDDTVQEAVHRDVSRIVQRARHSSVAFVAASLRLKQNLANFPLDSDGRRVYTNYKAVLQSRSMPELKPVRIPDKLVCEQVYRFGRESLEDWTHLIPLMSQLTPRLHRETIPQATALKLDYLQCVLEQGSAYSIPKIRDGCDLEALATGMLGHTHVEDTEGDHWFWMLIDLSVRRKRHVKTKFALDVRAMAMPATMQHMSAWRPRPHQAAGQDVFADGDPEVVDVIRLAPWPVLRNELRQWQTRGDSDVLGCMCLRDPVLVADIEWDDIDVAIPALVVVERLLSRGWRLGARRVPPHTLQSPRVFCSCKFVAMKAYLQCLLVLPTLLQHADFTELPSCAPAAYYACVLRATDPACVPRHCTQAQYNVILRNCDIGTPASGHEVPITAEEQLEATESEDCPISAMVGVDTAEEAATAHSQLLRRPVSGPPLSELVPVLDGGSACEDKGAVSASSSMASSSSMVAGLDDICAATGVPVITAVPVITRVEGVRLITDVHGEFGQVGYYRRFRVTCPAACFGHCSSRGVCSKRRGTGPAQTAHFGPLEPVAYLGVWLRQSDSCASRQSHMAFQPSVAQVQAYMIEQGWLGH